MSATRRRVISQERWDWASTSQVFAVSKYQYVLLQRSKQSYMNAEQAELVLALQDARAALSAAGWHAAVVAAFVAFVRVNGSIVVGDKEAHTAVLHGVQPLYAAAFFCSAFVCILPYAAVLRRCVSCVQMPAQTHGHHDRRCPGSR